MKYSDFTNGTATESIKIEISEGYNVYKRSDGTFTFAPTGIGWCKDIKLPYNQDQEYTFICDVCGGYSRKSFCGQCSFLEDDYCSKLNKKLGNWKTGVGIAICNHCPTCHGNPEIKANITVEVVKKPDGFYFNIEGYVMKYIVRINCPCYQDIEVEAENEEDAEKQALIEFQCPGYEGEFGEFIKE